MNPQSIQAEWLATGQAARALNICPNYVRILAKRGVFEYVHTPLGRLYNPASLSGWSRQRAAKKAAAPRVALRSSL